MSYLPEHSHHVDEQVHLTVDIPNLGLQSGEAGRVCGIWSFDPDIYEVQFNKPDESYPTHALLSDDQIQTDEQPSS